MNQGHFRHRLLNSTGSRHSPFPSPAAPIRAVQRDAIQRAHFDGAETVEDRSMSGGACRLPPADEADAALVTARRETEQDHNNATAWETLGTLFLKRSAFPQAQACYQQALQIDPGRLAVSNNLAITLEALGRFGEAEACYRAMLSRGAQDPEITLNLAVLLGRMGKHLEAFGLVQKVIQKSPQRARAHLIASALACDLGRFEEGLVCIDNAISLSPGETSLWIRRADILRQLSRNEESLTACDDVLRSLPQDSQTLHVKALTLRALGRAEEALDLMTSAEVSSPAPAKIMADKGWLFAELGRKNEALTAFERAIERQPDLSHAWYGRALLNHHQARDADVQKMEALLERDLANRDRINLSFALGKAYLERKDGEHAFRHLNTGNKLKRADFRYSAEADLTRIERIVGNFPAGAFAQTARSANVVQRPIFVFGMPRSGTTLVEQILASHPLVASIGEAGYLGDVAGKLGVGPDSSQATHDSIAASLPALRQQYLGVAGRCAGGKPHFADKMPTNFLNLGLIALAFPEAMLIHCRRNPLDTCLSCYSTLFTYGHEYSYEQRELGQYYCQYRRLMSHWHSILPTDRILDLDYEALVMDSKNQIERILEFCRLPWDAGCLKFYESKRHVATASFNQVRSPIYNTSLGRAEMFRPYLTSLETTLEGGMSHECPTPRSAD